MLPGASLYRRENGRLPGAGAMQPRHGSICNRSTKKAAPKDGFKDAAVAHG